MTVILITGAAGRTSSYVLRTLLTSVEPSSLRLLVRSQSAIRRIQSAHPSLPHSAFVIADYLEQRTLGPALEGVDIVFHNAPAFHPLESAMGIALIEAARKAGVKHFVYCSVLFSVLSKLLNHDCKRIVEEYLIESGLNYTILQPTSFMQNLDIQVMVEKGTLMCGFNPATFQGFVDLEDLAAVTKVVLLDPISHNRARYDIVGHNCTLEDVAKTFEQVTGKNVKCSQVPREKLLKHGVVGGKMESAYAADALGRMLYYYDKRGIPGNTNTVRWVLRREPTTWQVFIRRETQKLGNVVST